MNWKFYKTRDEIILFENYWWNIEIIINNWKFMIFIYIKFVYSIV